MQIWPKQERLAGPGHDSGRQETDTIAFVELRFDPLQILLDIDCHTTGGDFQSFAVALPLEITILFERAGAKPRQRRNRKQRRDGKEDGDSADLEPAQADLF